MKKTERLYFILVLLVSIPILLINLGIVPFIEDEGIRGLVALEMDHSGRYFTPTLYGESYYKKPPLWNWFLLSSYSIAGIPSEFASRTPTVLFIFVFAVTIYFVFKKFVNERIAILNALFFVTCGRILYWDSMLGLIDVLFSFVIFLLFIWIFYFHSKKKYLSLFVGAYLLASIAFLLKALPALVFLGFSLLAVHIYTGTFKKLFSWKHFAGFTTMSAIISVYLWAYSRHESVETLLAIFLDESTQRTVVEYGLLKTLFQIFTFPLEMIYHFLPWSAFVFIFFNRRIVEIIRQNKFITYCAIIFLANIWIYWSSPEVYPRYLFMFIPLFFGTALYAYYSNYTSATAKAVDVMLLSLGTIVFFGSLYVFFHEKSSDLEGIVTRWSLSSVPMAISLGLMFLSRKWRLHAFCVFLLAARLGFSLIILPLRSEGRLASQTKADCSRVAEKVDGRQLLIYKHDSLRYEAGFYLTASLAEPLSLADKTTESDLLLTNRTNYFNLRDDYRAIDSIRVLRDEKYVYLLERKMK